MKTPAADLLRAGAAVFSAAREASLSHPGLLFCTLGATASERDDDDDDDDDDGNGKRRGSRKRLDPLRDVGALRDRDLRVCDSIIDLRHGLHDGGLPRPG